MSSFKEKIQKIRELRQQRDAADRQLYIAKLGLFKTDKVLRSRKINETAPDDRGRKGLLALRTKMASLEGRSQLLNRQASSIARDLQKKRAIAKARQFLENKIALMERESRESETKLHEEKRKKKPEIRLIGELKKKIDNSSLSLEGLKRDLADLKPARKRLVRKQVKIFISKAKLTAERRKIQKEISLRKNSIKRTLLPRAADLRAAARLKIEQDEQHSRAKIQLSKHRDNLHKEIAGLFVEEHPKKLLTELTDNIPFLLLPLRLETRFMTPPGGPELWLRIYPDDIAIQTHEELLTDEEVSEGKKYWKALFDAEKTGGDGKENLKKSAWSTIVSQFGVYRSAWISQKTKPENWNRLDIASADQLVFPDNAITATHSWTSAPCTRVLPDKFVVLLYRGDAVREVVGNLVPDLLYVGPDPLDGKNSFVKKNDTVSFGESFDWMSDFDKAVQVGMGFKIKLGPEEAAKGFERILVLGVYLSADETESKKELEDLIDNHHYSPKGFSIVRQGTPTNNTEQDGSGYTRNENWSSIDYFTGKPLFQQDVDCDGRNLADALGIEYDRLALIENADAGDYRQSVLMNTALYPATLGYFLETLLHPVLNNDDADFLRKFFIENVTGRGPLPAIRVGNQPYGILLTSDFSKWWNKRERNNENAFFNKLHAVLFSYQLLWDGLVKDLKHVGTGEDPSEVLLNILGLQASSVSFNQRTGYSTDYLKNLDQFQSGGRYWPDVAKYNQKGDLLNFFRQFGYHAMEEKGGLKVPQVLRLIYEHYTTALDAGNLIDGVPLSEKNTIRNYTDDKNYLNWLAETSDIDTLERQNFGGGKTAPNALLYLMLRRALMLELHKASVQWFKQQNIDLEDTLNPKNFYNIRPGGDLTKYEVMRAKVGVGVPAHPQSGMTVSDYLLTKGSDEAQARYLGQMRAALEKLAGVATAKLERCFTEHLDTCTYRLDAWENALFRRRLLKQRNVPDTNERGNRNKNIYLGAYGWLENVGPAIKQAVSLAEVPEKLRPLSLPVRIDKNIFQKEVKKIRDEEVRKKIESLFTKDDAAGTVRLKEGLTDREKAELMRILGAFGFCRPFFEEAGNGGFVHAPSVNHASTGAILRSGYLSHADKDNPETMAVNLSSDRVRRALFILQGMRNGQTLEALLGYQFERGLHDRASADDDLADLNLYIYAFRDAFPCLQHPIQQQGSDSFSESIPPRDVVNGVALAESDSPLETISITITDDKERKAVLAEIDRLSDTLDAIKDLLLTESVYQMVQGNADRAGALLNALKDADIPSELEVINTPRSSNVTFTNRVTLQFEDADPTLDENNPWHQVPMTPRAYMEAGLNKWLGMILGQPDQIVYRVACTDADYKEIAGSAITMTLEDLDLQPIDLVYIIGSEMNTGAPEAGNENRTGASELETRIAYAYKQKKALDDPVVIRIQFLEPAEETNLGTFLPVFRMLKSIITDARHLHAQDFDPPSNDTNSVIDSDNPRGYDAANLQGRIENNISLFEACLNVTKTTQIDAVIAKKDGTYQGCSDFQAACTSMSETQTTFEDISFVQFSANEFKGNLSVDLLCSRLENDGLASGGDTLEDLNRMLDVQDLYDKVTGRYHDQAPSPALTGLRDAYQASGSGNDLERLNRGVLEEFYAAFTPKGKYQKGMLFQFNGATELLINLVNLSQFGISDVFPRLTSAATNEDKIALLDQAGRAVTIADIAIRNSRGLKDRADASSGIQQKIENYIAAGKALLGEAFNIMPLFNYNNESEIQKSNNDRFQLLKYPTETLNMPMPADEWLQNVSHVRPKVAQWDYLRTLSESLQDASLTVNPIQFPYRANDSWLALEFPATYEIIDAQTGETTVEPFTIKRDTLSIIIHGDHAFDPGARQSGLLIDDWTEAIPQRKETTGIVFNYNQPNSCPPQALLLAVTPQEKGYWTWDDLVGILNDTLQRAKRRAVDPIMLDKVKQPQLSVLLPAIVADFCSHDLNVSLDMRMSRPDIAKKIEQMQSGIAKA